MIAKTEHEEWLVRAFILPQRRDRYLEMIAKPKRRQILTESLILSCIPGRLAYFEDEEDRWILERMEKP
jgi:hypothetical protein